MVRHPKKPLRINEKLAQIRTLLGLTEDEMLRHLDLEEEFSSEDILNYELGQREPPLYVLLSYGRSVGVCLDVLVDEKMDLPELSEETGRRREPKNNLVQRRRRTVDRESQASDGPTRRTCSRSLER
jgi:transcriptional regulator with XRE-family HTH domain